MLYNYNNFVNENKNQKKPTRKDLKLGSLVETMGQFDRLDISRQLGKIIEFKEYGYILIEFITKFSPMLHAGHENIGKEKSCYYVALDNIIQIFDDELAQKIINKDVLPYKASTNLIRVFNRMKFEPDVDYLDVSFFDVDENSEDLITFLPAKKFDGDPTTKKGRQGVGVGKLLRRLKTNITPTAVEDFVVKYREAYGRIIKGNGRLIDVIVGEEIRYWYANTHYAKSQTGGSTELWNSCMSSPGTGKVLNLYCENPQKIALCIFLNDNDQLLARALVWNLDDGRVYMDRIYANTADQKQAMIQFANENGMITRDSGRAGNMTVTLPKDYGAKHRPSTGNPYMDTFRNACVGKDGTYFLSNTVPSNAQNYRNVYG